MSLIFPETDVRFLFQEGLRHISAVYEGVCKWLSGVCCSFPRWDLPVSEATGSQVGELTVFETTFNQLIQSFMKQRAMLSVHILHALSAHSKTNTKIDTHG